MRCYRDSCTKSETIIKCNANVAELDGTIKAMERERNFIIAEYFPYTPRDYHITVVIATNDEDDLVDAGELIGHINDKKLKSHIGYAYYECPSKEDLEEI